MCFDENLCEEIEKELELKPVLYRVKNEDEDVEQIFVEKLERYINDISNF